MVAHMQNPGLAPRASRDCFGRPPHVFFTASERQAQTLATRFYLSPWLARHVAWLCFGEGCSDD
jgi:protocatechuate 3,4-dioxygenase beta subunit